MQRNKIFSQYVQMFRRKILILQSIIKGEEEKTILIIKNNRKKWQN